MANTPAVPIDYTSKDFAGFKASLLQYAATAFPEWTNAQAALSGDGESDFGVVLVELFSYLGDILSWYGDRIANEAYLGTATQRSSVLAIADMLDYKPNGGIAATGTITFATDASGPAVVVPAGTQVQTDLVQSIDSPVVFETDYDITVPASGGTATVSITQGETITNETLGVSDGTIDQEYLLYMAPVIDGTVVVQVGDATNGYVTWSEIDHLIDAGPNDNVFSTYTDDKSVTHVLFGDGTAGAVPGNQATIRATYRVGGGAVGNLTSGKITTLVNAIQGVSIALDGSGNPQSSATTGGADPESIAQIRRNAPLAWKTQNRCVSLSDYANAALGVSGVAKAAAVGSNYSNVSVYIAAPGGAAPSSGLITAVQTYLNSRVLVGTTASVAAAALVPVNVTLTLGVLAQYKQSSVQDAVTKALQDLLSFDNQDFASRVSVSDVYRTIAEVPGVDYASVTNLARSDATQGSVGDVVVRAWEIPSAGTISVSSITGGIA